MLLADVVFTLHLLDRFERETVQSWTLASPSVMFGSSTATLWILPSKVYGPTITSTVCVYEKDLLQKVLTAHSTY